MEDQKCKMTKNFLCTGNGQERRQIGWVQEDRNPRCFGNSGICQKLNARNIPRCKAARAGIIWRLIPSAMTNILAHSDESAPGVSGIDDVTPTFDEPGQCAGRHFANEYA